MKLGAGLKWTGIAALVLGVISILYFGTQFIQESERDKIQIELQEKTDERRDTIREEVERATPVDPGDATDSLRFLEERQSRGK